MPRLPLVSVVIPAHNAAAYLTEALYSVAAQVYRNIQVIVVNDGSTDGVDAIIDRFLDGSKDVYVSFETKRGLPAALNAGMQKAEGDFIARFDADDYMYSWRLHDQVNYFVEHPEIALLGTGADLMGAARGHYMSPAGHEAIVDAFLTGNPFIHPTVAFRRQLFDRGLVRYTEGLPTEEDYELWSRLLPQVRAANIDKRLIKYRIHDANNQRHPSKREIKVQALKQFLAPWLSPSTQLLEAFADLQCSGFITHSSYSALREYARNWRPGWPRVGWLHDKLLGTDNYRDFMWLERHPRR